jgi:hypothetical protein
VGRVFAVALLLVAACGGSPSSPSRPPASPAPVPVTFADFSGLWTAKYRITACDWERHCVLYIGTERSFDLRLVQVGSHVRGLYVDNGSATDVEGDVSSDGTLVMSGSSGPVSARDGSFRVTEVRVRLASAPDLQGQVSYESRLPPEYSEYELGMKATGEIVSATRSGLGAFVDSTDGTYHGRFVVRRCTPYTTYCYPNDIDEVPDLVLTVTHDASAVSATYQQGGTRVPLHGTLSGRTLLLDGETTTGTPGFEALNRVTAWRTTLDEFGRMSGTFHFDLVYTIANPSFGGGIDGELVQLVKTTH